MPWLAAAIVGSSIIGGVANAVAGSKAASSAQAGADAQAAAANNATALQRDIYNTTRTDNEPFRNEGLTALSAVNSRLGLSDAGINTALAGFQPAAGGPDYAAYVQSQPDLMQYYQEHAQTDNLGSLADWGAQHYQMFGQNEGRALPTVAALAGADGVNQVAGGAPAATPGQFSSGVSTTRPDYVRPTAGARPEITAAPTYQAPTYTPSTLTAAPTYSNPALTAAPTYTGHALTAAPTLTRPGAAPLDVSQAAYTPSPDYQIQLDAGNKNLVASLSAVGGLESGAAIKRAQELGQQTALKDYQDWRDYTTGQYNITNSRLDSNYNFDAALADRQWEFGNTYDQNDAQFGAGIANQQWQYGNTYNQNNAQFDAGLQNTQWQYGNTYNQQNAQFGATYDQNNAQFGQSQAADNWRFLTAAEQQAYENDTNRSDANFNTDRAYGTDVYNSDRGYDANRSDTQINQLLALAGYGPAATNATSQAGQAYADASQQAGFTAANAQSSAYAAQGNAWLAGASSFNNTLNNGVGAYAYTQGVGTKKAA